MEQRKDLLIHWLQKQFNQNLPELEIASSDASFRQYFRISFEENSYIIMDAPPDKENCHPFVGITDEFQKAGLHTPKVYAKDFTLGFLLLEDFGKTTYLEILQENTVDKLYQDALNSLLHLQNHQNYSYAFPDYSEAIFQREMLLFKDWFLEKHLAITLTVAEEKLLEETFKQLRELALQQTAVIVHRDYHSRNLMHVPDKNPGVIDFQDAVIGAITYDIVSLLRDCYIAWPQEKIMGWLEDYFYQIKMDKKLALDFEIFKQWFDWMGIQRHLKAIGIFSRLNHRDNKSGYLPDIPRTFNYMQTVSSEYSQLHSFSQWLATIKEKI